MGADQILHPVSTLWPWRPHRLKWSCFHFPNSVCVYEAATMKCLCRDLKQPHVWPLNLLEVSHNNDSVILEAVCLLNFSIQSCPIIRLLGYFTESISPLTFQSRRASKIINLQSPHVLEEEETEAQGLNRNFLWTTEHSLSVLNRFGSYNSNSTKKVIPRR